MAKPTVPSLWWSPSRGLIERFVEGEGAYYLARGRGAGQLPDDAVRLVPYQVRSYWTSQHTWTDPDCFECGGEGAPCCEPPDYPWPGGATDQNDELRARLDAVLALLDEALEDLAHAIPYAGEYFDEKWSMSANLGEFRRRRALLSPAPTPAAETPTPIEETDHG